MRLGRIRQFHEDPQVVAFWCTLFGPLLAWATPGRRRAILAVLVLAAGIWVVSRTLGKVDGFAVPTDTFGIVCVVAALLAMLWLCYQAARCFAQLPAFIRQHPQVTLHGLFWCLLGVLWLTTPDQGPWRLILVGVAVTFPLFIWRCSYLLLSGQRGKVAETRFPDHLIYLFPPLGGMPTPHGKGLDFLSRHEAHDAEELARSQLAGIKLLFLAVLWQGARMLMDAVVYGSPGNSFAQALGGTSLSIPRLGILVENVANTPRLIAWASVYCELVYQVLVLAVRGHIVIAVLRLFGFNVFRNTYKPLLSESIVEFWNRYYYYFKELVSDFFFLPTFARRFRSHPRLRLFAAVFAAAGIGNMYYHILVLEAFDNPALIVGDLPGLWQAFHSRFFYCVLLAFGIWISMLRVQMRAGEAPSPAFARRFLRIAGVWTFFALIIIWNVKADASFIPRTKFFLHLFGVA